MTDSYAEAHRQYFRGKIAEHGVTDRVLWNSTTSQEARFRALAESGIQAGDSVLDVGTGFGDFYRHLIESGRRPDRFLGLDLLPECIQEARQRCGATPEFQVGSLADVGNQHFDWVVASGIFFLPAPDWTARVEEWLRTAFAVATRGVAVNFLSSYSPSPDARSHYANPADLLTIAMQVTRRVTLRHDYLPHDFTVCLRRDDSGPPR